MHKTEEVKYAAEILNGGFTLPAGWTAQRAGDGRYGVSGPCPECLGSAYGPPARQAATEVAFAMTTILQVSRDPENAREILASCACGYDHGKPGADSCGRKWIVRVMTSEEDR